MRRKKNGHKAELGNKVVSIEVISDEEMASISGGREWGWWEVQPANYGGGYSGGYGGGGWGDGYGGGGWGGGYGGGGYGGGYW